MVEFLGGDCLRDASCAYILGCPEESKNLDATLHPDAFPTLLQQGLDVSRSLWDTRFLIAHLDIEYVNFDFPGEAYLHPQRIFSMQRPVVHAIQRLLLQWEIVPLHLLTGRGHHFVWKIDRNSDAFHQLKQLGRISTTLEGRYQEPCAPRGLCVEHSLGQAFAGLGLLMEYLGHMAKHQVIGNSQLSVQLTDIEVGATGQSCCGREVISIDLSEYADPLHKRHIRVPFSVYLKPFQNRNAVGEHVLAATPPIFEIPLFEMAEEEAIEVMRSAEETMELAGRASVHIPEQSSGTQRLLEHYRQSSLKSFHDWFYQQDHHPPEHWRSTYDRCQLDQLPSCTRHILQHPNDLLLKPAGIQHLVRVFSALGWHPRHIAGLIRSKYERDFNWGDRWYQRDAATRADGYTRLFAGLIATGVDDAVDLNCVSNREKGYCFEPECGHNLADYRDSLRARKDHERLGCRPFDGLFLPNQHF